VEWYDFALFGALGVVLIPTFFPRLVGPAVVLAAFALYGTAFVVRPLGAVLIGRRGDSQGRRRVLITVIAVMTAATAAVGLLPGFAQIGWVAPVVLVGLRVAQGLAAGGELGVAAVFMVEYAPERRRAAVGAWHTATLAVGLAFGLGVACVVALLPERALAEGWWRVAFLSAVPLGLVGVYLRQRVGETPRFADLEHPGGRSTPPLGVVWSRHRRALRTGFGVIAAGSLTLNTFFVYLPNHLVATTSRTLPEGLLAAIVGLLAAAVSALVCGRLSDRLGRRPVVRGALTGLVLCAVPAIVAAPGASLVALVLVMVTAGVLVGGTLSVSMLVEMFPTEVRASGLSLTAGLAAALVGGTAPFLDQALLKVTGLEAAPAVYVTAVAGLALAASWSWPETAFLPLDQTTSTLREEGPALRSRLRSRPGSPSGHRAVRVARRRA
jgi:MHS family proline/betaine transporter-like MFS transporter